MEAQEGSPELNNLVSGVWRALSTQMRLRGLDLLNVGVCRIWH